MGEEECPNFSSSKKRERQDEGELQVADRACRPQTQFDEEPERGYRIAVTASNSCAKLGTFGGMVAS
jgi:hypothetical protein